ncbi:MAG: ABC transporter ATP-binding protein [Alphaproteobacteria bacterium]
MAEPLLKIEGLHAGYSGQPVLSDVSLEVHEGTLITLIGPNGHGKSTLLRCVAGLHRPSKGTIAFAGERVEGMDAERMVAKGLVLIPQGDLLFPEMSVYDNLRLGAFLPTARAEFSRRIEEIYALLPRLKERRTQLARTLSGGERRMLAIGRGLLTGGRMLMLDEPSLGLAPIVIDQIYEIILGLKSQGRTILLVEENASRVLDISQQIHLLDSGRIVWQGDGVDLQSQPQILETYLGG